MTNEVMMNKVYIERGVAFEKVKKSTNLDEIIEFLNNKNNGLFYWARIVPGFRFIFEIIGTYNPGFLVKDFEDNIVAPLRATIDHLVEVCDSNYLRDLDETALVALRKTFENVDGGLRSVASKVDTTTMSTQIDAKISEIKGLLPGKERIRGFSEIENEIATIKSEGQFVDIMDRYSSLMREAQGKNILEGELLALSNCARKLSDHYKGSEKTGPVKEVYHKVLVAIAQLDVTCIPTKTGPLKIEEEREAVPKGIMQAYDEVRDTSGTLMVHMDNIRKVLIVLSQNTKNRKEQLIIAQAILDLDRLRTDFLNLNSAFYFKNPSAPTKTELEGIDSAIGDIQKHLISLGRCNAALMTLNKVYYEMPESSVKRKVKELTGLDPKGVQDLFIKLVQFPLKVEGLMKGIADREVNQGNYLFFVAMEKRYKKYVADPQNSLYASFSEALEVLSADELQASLEYFKLEGDLVAIFEVLRGLKPNEKLHLEKGKLVAKVRKGTGTPRESVKAYRYILDRLGKACELKILEFDTDQARCGIHVIIDQMSNNPWVMSILEIKSQKPLFEACQEQVTQVEAEVAENDIRALGEVHGIELPKQVSASLEGIAVINVDEQLSDKNKRIKQLQDKITGLRGQLPQAGGWGDYITGADRRIQLQILEKEGEIETCRKAIGQLEAFKEAEKQAPYLQIVQKMHPLEHRALVPLDKLGDCVDPNDLIYSYHEIMTTKELLNNVLLALDNDKLPSSQKVIIGNFVVAWITSGLYNEECKEHRELLLKIADHAGEKKEVIQETVEEIASLSTPPPKPPIRKFQDLIEKEGGSWVCE